jgi:hypothetical protein
LNSVSWPSPFNSELAFSSCLHLIIRNLLIQEKITCWSENGIDGALNSTSYSIYEIYIRHKLDFQFWGILITRPNIVECKNIFTLSSWKPLKKRAGSGSWARSMIHKYGSADPDPNQNVRNTEHRLLLVHLMPCCSIRCMISLSSLRYRSLSRSSID